MPARHAYSHRRKLLLAERARQNRFAPTAEEALLWRALKAGQLGVAFKRQVPLVGRYIADFFAPRVGLIVEVDGPYHARRRRADARRDRVLRRAGYRVLRLEAQLVRRELTVALARIREALTPIDSG